MSKKTKKRKLQGPPQQGQPRQAAARRPVAVDVAVTSRAAPSLQPAGALLDRGARRVLAGRRPTRSAIVVARQLGAPRLVGRG